MHPKGSSPERNAANNPEKSRPLVSPEQRFALGNLQENLRLLFYSLTRNEVNSIKFIYGRLLDEQSTERPDPTLIHQLKNELLGAYIPFHTKLSQILVSDFSPEIFKFFKNHNIDLPNLTEDMLADITKLMTHRLPENKEQNPFRLSVWTERINIAINTTQRLLSET